jgi:hypothetical protein
MDRRRAYWYWQQDVPKGASMSGPGAVQTYAGSRILRGAAAGKGSLWMRKPRDEAEDAGSAGANGVSMSSR